MLSGLQTTLGRQTLANQNLLVSNEILHVLGHYIRRIFFIVNHLTVKKNNNPTRVNYNLSYDDVKVTKQHYHG